MKFFLILITFLISAKVFSAEELPPYDSQNLWVGPTVSLFVGFGIGVGLQGRFEDRGIYYGIADTVGFVAILKVSVDCNSQAKEAKETGVSKGECQVSDAENFAVYVWLASRVAQVIDSSIWSYQYYNKYKSTAFILPKDDGLSLNYAIEF